MTSFFAGNGKADEKIYLRFESMGHTAKINWIHFSPDGKSLYSAGDDKVVRVWNIADPGKPQLQRTMRGRIGLGPEGMIYSGAMSPDGRLLAFGGFFGQSGDAYAHSVRIFDAASGKIVAALKAARGTPFGLAFSPDGQRLACGNLERSLAVWNLAPGLNAGDWKKVDTQCTMLAELDWVNPGVVFPANDRLISCGYDRRVRFWELDAAGRWQAKAARREHTDKVRCVAASADGRFAATAGFDKHLRLWDARSGESLRILNQGETGMNSVLFAGDDRSLFAAGGDGIIRRWQVADGKLLQAYPKQAGSILALDLSADGNLLASAASRDDEIVLWDTQAAKPRARIAATARAVGMVRFSSDGRFVGFADNRGGIPQQAFDLTACSVAAVKAGDQSMQWPKMPTAQGELAVVKKNRNTVQVRRNSSQLAEVRRSWGWDIIHFFGFVPGADQLVVGSDFGLTLNDALTGKTLRDFHGHDGAILDAAVSLDGRLLASCAEDTTWKLWNIHTGELLFTVFTNKGFTNSEGDWAAVTPSGLFACSAGGEKLIGWHVNVGPDREAAYVAASQFHKQLYRPDVMVKVAGCGSVAEARRLADQATVGSKPETLGVEALIGQALVQRAEPVRQR